MNQILIYIHVHTNIAWHEHDFKNLVSDNLSIYLSVLTYNRHQQQLCEQNKLVAQLNRSQMKRKNFIYFILEKKNDVVFKFTK